MTNDANTIIAHNVDIMEDNLFFGYKNGYSKKDTASYEQAARRELGQLKAHLKRHGTVAFDKTTATYVPVT